MIELPRITSSMGSSGRDSGEDRGAKGLVDGGEEDIEEDWVGACVPWSSPYDFARALSSVSSLEGPLSFLSRFHHIKFNVLSVFDAVDCLFGTRQRTIAIFPPRSGVRVWDLLREQPIKFRVASLNKFTQSPPPLFPSTTVAPPSQLQKGRPWLKSNSTPKSFIDVQRDFSPSGRYLLPPMTQRSRGRTNRETFSTLPLNYLTGLY